MQRSEQQTGSIHKRQKSITPRRMHLPGNAEERCKKHMKTFELENERTPDTVCKTVMDVQNIIKSLPLGRDRIEILKGISFQIMSGEFVAIVGPSGSGKSTLLGIIAGLDNPTTGQVFIDGVDITRMTEGKLAAVRNSKIGM